MMQRTLALLTTTVIACAGMTAACGDDTGVNPQQDAGHPADGGGGGGSDGGGGGGSDGGGEGGACTFATYVVGLVTTSTSASAKPDTTLGAGCADTTSQTEFQSLFP